MRKFEALNLMKLYSLGSANGWNQELTKLYKAHDINGLARLRYQLAAGMDDLAKKKLNTEDMCVWFLRLNRSIENTAKKIIREKHPLPEDNPLAHESYSLDSAAQKKKRDHDLTLFLKNSAY